MHSTLRSPGCTHVMVADCRTLADMQILCSLANTLDAGYALGSDSCLKLLYTISSGPAIPRYVTPSQYHTLK